MAFKYVLLASIVASVGLCEPQRLRIDPRPLDFDFNLDPNTPTTTPVPILRLVDTQNPDGSYTYGYESGDGTYKIETRFATGEVKGKYGYVDSNGNLREVEYGATPERGFEPRAEGLVLPPPTLAQTTTETPETVAAAFAAPVRRPAAKRVVTSKFANFGEAATAPAAPARKRVVVRKQKKNRRLPIRGRSKPASRRPAFAPTAPTAPAAPAAPVAAPQQFTAPAFPAGFAPSFQGHPAQNINLQDGSFTLSYGK